jgi:hypothetical protein
MLTHCNFYQIFGEIEITMVVQTHLKSISGKGKGELVKGRNVTPPYNQTSLSAH